MPGAVDSRSLPARAPGVQELEREDELLLFFDVRERGFVLNRSARAVWDLCDGRRTVRDVSRVLEAQLELPRDALFGDVRDTVQGLIAARVLVSRYEPESCEAGLPIDWRALARPSAAARDVRMALARFRARNPRSSAWSAPDRRARPSVLTCDGEVALEYAYRGAIVAANPPQAKLVDAPLDHPNIALAEEHLRRWPAGMQAVRFLIQSFHPVLDPALPSDETAFLASSCCHSADFEPFFGRMWSTVNCPLMLAENFVHEAAHQKLFALGILKESCHGLITNSPHDGFKSPVITNRPRPMTALVHGVYAYLYVTRLDLEVLAAEPAGPRRQRIVARLRTNVDRIEAGLAEMRPHLQVDSEGRAFFEGLYAWAEELVEEGERAARVPARSTRSGERVEVVDAPVRVFIGSDPAQRKAEIALEHGIRKYTRGPVEIVWMDFWRGGPWGEWDIGRERGRIPSGDGPGWSTEFSCYRFALPEAAGFRGRAIYLESSMLVLGDLRKLFELPMSKPWLTTREPFAAGLVDCARFADESWWPRIQAMRRSRFDVGDYVARLREHDALDERLPESWTSVDGEGYGPASTRILHFSNPRTQPWMPHPDRIRYEPHPREDLVELWWRTYLAGRRELGASPRPEYGRQNASPRYYGALERFRRAHAQVGDAPRVASLELMGLGLLPHVRAVKHWIHRCGARTLLDYGSGQGWQYGEVVTADDSGISAVVGELLRRAGIAERSVTNHWGVERPVCYDPAYPPFSSLPGGPFDGVICTDVLHHCPEEDLGWVVRELFALARQFLVVAVRTHSSSAPEQAHEEPYGTRRPGEWWKELFRRSALDRPGVRCQLFLCGSAGASVPEASA